MHVGHIRSTVLGDALARIAQFFGHEVIRDNHIGDWGTQFGMVIYGWKNLLDRERLQHDPIAELVRIYKETNERATNDPAVREAAREELVKLQAGEKENFPSGRSASRFPSVSLRRRTRSSTSITISNAGKVFTTIAFWVWSNDCSTLESQKLAKAQSAFSFLMFPSWRTNRL